MPIPLLDTIIGPITRIIDKVIPDPKARDEANSADPWTSRARPSFLYVMYVMILWALPMGLIAAFRSDAAASIASGMNAYLNGLPEPLYALFGTGYLGYTAARQWGKIKGSDN